MWKGDRYGRLLVVAGVWEGGGQYLLPVRTRLGAGRAEGDRSSGFCCNVEHIVDHVTAVVKLGVATC